MISKSLCFFLMRCSGHLIVCAYLINQTDGFLVEILLYCVAFVFCAVVIAWQLPQQTGLSVLFSQCALHCSFCEALSVCWSRWLKNKSLQYHSESSNYIFSVKIYIVDMKDFGLRWHLIFSPCKPEARLKKKHLRINLLFVFISLVLYWLLLFLYFCRIAHFHLLFPLWQ